MTAQEEARGTKKRKRVEGIDDDLEPQIDATTKPADEAAVEEEAALQAEAIIDLHEALDSIAADEGDGEIDENIDNAQIDGSTARRIAISELLC